MRLVNILLLFSIIPIIILPPALSVTFTTVTNLTTVTNIFTTNTYTTNTLGVTKVPLTEVLRGAALLGAGNRQGQIGVQCTLIYNVTIPSGVTEVTGTIGPASGSDGNSPISSTFTPRSVPFNFYIMNNEQYVFFLNYIANQQDCSSPAPFGIVHEQVTTIYTLDWKSPTPGPHYLIFQKYQDRLPYGVYEYTTTSNGNAIATSVTVLFNRITIPFVIQLNFNPATSTMYTVIPTPLTLTTTRTQTSIQVTQAVNAMEPFNSPTLIAIIIALPVALVTLFLLRRRATNAK